jgi:hypothetical protein
VTISTSQQDYPMLIGNVTSLGLSIIISTIGSLVWPENYSFDETRALHTHSEASEVIEPSTPSAEEESKEIETKGGVVPRIDSETSSLAEVGGREDNVVSYKREFNLARNVSVPMFIILLVRHPAAHLSRYSQVVFERQS